MIVLADLVRQVRLEAGWSAPDAEKEPLQDVIGTFGSTLLTMPTLHLD